MEYPTLFEGEAASCDVATTGVTAFGGLCLFVLFEALGALDEIILPGEERADWPLLATDGEYSEDSSLREGSWVFAL